MRRVKRFSKLIRGRRELRLNTHFQHHPEKTTIRDDGSDRVTFKWHFTRGTFDRRMSAREIAVFILPMMHGILPYLEHHPMVHAQFKELMVRLATCPPDEVVPWIQRLDFMEEDEILQLDLSEDRLPPPAPVTFDMGAACLG